MISEAHPRGQQLPLVVCGLRGFQPQHSLVLAPCWDGTMEWSTRCELVYLYRVGRPVPLSGLKHNHLVIRFKAKTYEVLACIMQPFDRILGISIPKGIFFRRPWTLIGPENTVYQKSKNHRPVLSQRRKSVQISAKKKPQRKKDGQTRKAEGATDVSTHVEVPSPIWTWIGPDIEGGPALGVPNHVTLPFKRVGCGLWALGGLVTQGRVNRFLWPLILGHSGKKSCVPIEPHSKTHAFLPSRGAIRGVGKKRSTHPALGGGIHIYMTYLNLWDS